MIVTDQLNRTITLHTSPKRIISLVPSLTELLCDLGLEEYIVGVTKFCVHPEHIRKTKTIIGGTKFVNFKKIPQLKPDLILANKEENTPEIIQELSYISPIHISDIITIEDCLELVKMYGEIFNIESRTDNLIAGITNDLIKFKKLIIKEPIKKVAYFIWKDPYMVAADGTFINIMLRLNKFDNVFKNKTRYPEVNLVEIDKSLDFIFLSSEPFPFKEKHVSKMQSQYPNATVVLVNGEMFSWYGSRITKAFKYFIQLRESLNKIP